MDGGPISVVSLLTIDILLLYFRVDWVSNCTAGNITVGKYPLPLPGGVAVPNWAYLDFTQQDQFQTQVAQQVAGTCKQFCWFQRFTLGMTGFSLQRPSL